MIFSSPDTVWWRPVTMAGSLSDGVKWDSGWVSCLDEPAILDLWLRPTPWARERLPSQSTRLRRNVWWVWCLNIAHGFSVWLRTTTWMIHLGEMSELRRLHAQTHLSDKWSLLLGLISHNIPTSLTLPLFLCFSPPRDQVHQSDSLSSRICHACISYLNSWQSFKNRCYAAQRKQKTWLAIQLQRQLSNSRNEDVADAKKRRFSPSEVDDQQVAGKRTRETSPDEDFYPEKQPKSNSVSTSQRPSVAESEVSKKQFFLV